MIFNAHSKLVGLHAFLSPSNYHWINYDLDKLERVYATSVTARRGTELHALAHQLIRLGVKLPTAGKTLNMYVNDAIGFKMQPEQILFYSENVFGTADVISFRRNFLRIHDLKTGQTPASEHQLEVYAALFCLEYKVPPQSIQIELRIYQNDEYQAFKPSFDTIYHIMDKIVTFDKHINLMRLEDAQ